MKAKWGDIVAAALLPPDSKNFAELVREYLRENPEAEEYLEHLIETNQEAGEEALGIAARNLREALAYDWPVDPEDAYDFLVASFPVGDHRIDDE
ncbi:hypothetical protein [Thermus filiformis]|jgi:hypothetical protein|uniref:Uncharacterized protein n=1 Tax=Thermus filiformis TaxID=276 RepID=A0A0D6X952_THEFI|nr:hypothetical protein [Thermus filiformis]KIX84444.1 hypothetical protein THFILI_11850 [Thermus filiformis]